MPPIVKPQLPAYIDPSQASVFDSLPHTLLRRAVGVVGGNDPASVVAGAMGDPLPSGGTAVTNPRSLIREFLDIIKNSPAPDPAKTFLNDKVTGALIPHRTPIIPPQGFEFPAEMGPAYTGRDPGLIEKFVTQRDSYAPTALQMEKNKIQSGGSYVRPQSTMQGRSDMIRAMKAQGYSPDEIMKINPNIHPNSIMRIFGADDK